MSRENANTKNIITGCLCALGAATFYGFSFIFTRQAVNFASAFALLGWRFFIAFVVMLTLVLTGVVKTDLKKKKLGPLLLMALLFPTIYFTGETLGIKLTTATESGVFIAAIPVTAIIASSLILKKKPFRRQVAGILVTMAGVAITIFAVGTAASFSPAGYMFLVLAVVSYSLYCVMVEKHTEYTGAEITFLILTFGAAAFGIIAMVEAGLGISIMPELVLAKLSGRIGVYPVESAPVRVIGLATQKSEYLSRAATAFTRIVQAYIRERYPGDLPYFR